MTIRFATNQEIATWNDQIVANADGGNVFQGYEFSQQKQQVGWTPRYLMADGCAITVLERFFVGVGKLWYIPKGPASASPDALHPLLEPLRDFAHQQGVFVVTIEPEIIRSDQTLQAMTNYGLHKVRPIQPNFSTVVLDLQPTTDEILATMPQKGRYAIKRAQRDGATVKQVAPTDDNLQLLFTLISDTMAERAHIRSGAYYQAFWRKYTASGRGHVFFVYDTDGQVLAGAFVIVMGQKATYKDGGSRRERGSIYGASHFLQWRIIEWLKTQNVTSYDLCGAPIPSEINNPQHPHHGIGVFKTSFNKQVTEFVGAYDMVIRPRAYRVWKKIGERLVLLATRKLGDGFFY